VRWLALRGLALRPLRRLALCQLALKAWHQVVPWTTSSRWWKLRQKPPQLVAQLAQPLCLSGWMRS
jgi:hypothetical protein